MRRENGSVNLVGKTSELKLNIVTTLVNLLLGFLVGVILTPFLVAQLGPARFGLVPLINALVSYFAIFPQTISAAISRNLTLAVHNDDRARAQRIYFTSIAAVGLAILILSVPLTLLSVNIASLVNVPPGAEVEGRVLSLAISWTFLLSIGLLPFQSVSFCTNKTYLLALSSALQNVLRLGLTVALVLLLAANLTSVGVAIVLSCCASFAFLALTTFRVAPWLNPMKRSFDGAEFLDLFKLSADILLMQVGTVAMMSSELVVVNLVFGDYTGGRYAAAVQLPYMLRNGITSLATLAAPVIIANYARGDVELLAKSTIRAMRCIALAIALPTGFLAAAASETLALWLGTDFSTLSNLLALQSLALVLTSVVVPLYSVCLAARRIWFPGAVQMLGAILFVGLAWLGSHSFDGPVAMACLFLGIFVVKELAYTIPYSAHCMGINSSRFMSPIVYSLALFLVAYVATTALGEVWPARSRIGLASIAIAVTVPYTLMAWLLATYEERTETASLVRGTGVGRWLFGIAQSAK